MNIEEFFEILNQLKEEKPILFGLDSDAAVNDDLIATYEEYYGITFSESYKAVLRTIGGGYMGYTVMYSLDESGSFNIKNYVAPEMVSSMEMLPIIDLENGDLLGFNVSDSVCSDDVYCFNHDDGSKRKVYNDLFDALIEIGFKNDLSKLE